MARQHQPELAPEHETTEREPGQQEREHGEVERAVVVGNVEARRRQHQPGRPTGRGVQVERELLDDEEQRQRHDRERHVPRSKGDPGQRERSQGDADPDQWQHQQNGL